MHHHNRFPVADNVSSMAPYQAGRPVEDLARSYGLDPDGIIKMASNENPLGFSDHVRRALIRQLQDHSLQSLARYPDANGFELKAALSRHYGIAPEAITLGNGSNDLLEIISLAFLNAGRSCVYPQHSFVVYRLSTQGRAARHIEVPALNYGADLDAMYEAISPDTSLVFLANPNNPTGTFHSGAALESFLQKVYDRYGRSVLVVLDEAYTEYLEPEQGYCSIDWLSRWDNLIVTRTFSKAYGLAAWRIGFAAAHPEITDYLNRVRQPFNVGTLAQAAAIAALEDQHFIRKTRNLNTEGKVYLTEQFDQLGLQYVPSYANFVLLELGARTEQINEGLLQQGIIVRPVASDGLPGHLRISIGLPQENQAFIEALKKCL